MIERRCPHCESEIEVLEARRISCPVCGLDPDLPRLAFDDAPAFFLAGDPRRLEPTPVGEPVREGSAA
ncbi:MAG: hypothetical protein ACRDGV_08995 [Candidatus Limnocylindria bacterium]